MMFALEVTHDRSNELLCSSEIGLADDCCVTAAYL